MNPVSLPRSIKEAAKEYAFDFAEHDSFDYADYEASWKKAGYAGAEAGFQAGAQLVLEKLVRAREGLDGILSNVALDWYVQQFARDTTPSNGSSGVVARIHNHGTAERAGAAFERARKVLAEIDAFLKGDKA